MSRQTDGTDSAMPTVEAAEYPFGVGEKRLGLTKREYFAARAMQGRLSNTNMYERHAAAYDDVAKDAVLWADALIRELNRTGGADAAADKD